MSTLSALLGGGIKSVQTGYVSTSTISASTSEDENYVDVTITAVADYQKCLCIFQGGMAGSTGGVSDGQAMAKGDTSYSHEVTARLTSTTNLRLSSTMVVNTNKYLAGRWYVVEYV
jgi:hypothetical protein